MLYVHYIDNDIWLYYVLFYFGSKVEYGFTSREKKRKNPA